MSSADVPAAVPDAEPVPDAVPVPVPDAAERASSQLVDVLDEAGRVVGRASRAEIRAGNLWHRSVFVVVLTSQDDVVVHRRADWKDVWPSRWDVCFGGLLAAGESWEAGACRELAEEAGVVVEAGELLALGEGRYEDARVREIGRVYLVRSDGPFSFPDGEVAESGLVGFDGLDEWLVDHDVVDDSRLLVLPSLGVWRAAGQPEPF